MCSKNAEPHTGLPQAKSKSGWSIQRRLTFLYLASTAALLLSAAGFLYWNLKTNLDTARYAMLTGKIEVLQLLLKEQPSKADELGDEVEHEASPTHLLRFYIRILDERGRVAFESAGMSDLLPPALFPAPSPSNYSALNPVERKVDKKLFVLLTLQAPAGPAGREQWTLQVAHDISAHRDYRPSLRLYSAAYRLA